MQFTPLQIKEKLLKALDDQNNVVDAQAVLEVISILEQYPITKEALEQTRIGRHVNELRKKTTNEQLAKRAKKLVRNWQKLVNTDGDGKQTVNGERVVTPPQHPNVAALQSGGNGGISPRLYQGDSSNRQCLSPALAGGRPLTPQMGRKISPSLSGGKPGTPAHLSPLLKHSSSSKPSTPSGKPLTPSLQTPRSSPIPGNRSSQADGGKRSITPTISSPHPVDKRASPQLGSTRGKKDISPPVNFNTSSPKSQSPLGVRPATPSSRALTPSLGSRPQTPNNNNDDSNLSWPGTPLSSSGRSDREKNNSNSKWKGKSKGESPVSGAGKDVADVNSKSNHSAEFSFSNSSDRGSRKDQSDTSKTNVANRKRTRGKSPDSVPKKQPKNDSSLSKQKRESTINGVVGSHKQKGADLPRSNSATSLSYSKAEVSPVSPGNTDASSQSSSKKHVNSKADAASKAAKNSKKVKTTAEIIAEMQKHTGCSSYGNDIMNKLMSNQIEKEVDAPGSILPPGVKPRKKRGSMSSDNLALLDTPSPMALSQTKTEMVEKFLESSVAPSTSEQLSPYKDDHKCESPMDSTNSFGEAPNDSIGDSVADLSMERPERPPSRYECKQESGVEAQLSLEEILRLLPPVDKDNVDWEAHEYSLAETTTGSESEVSRLHSEHWECVNGSYDVQGVWHDWSQTLSLATCDGDLLHILPYVNIDD